MSEEEQPLLCEEMMNLENLSINENVDPDKIKLESELKGVCDELRKSLANRNDCIVRLFEIHKRMFVLEQNITEKNKEWLLWWSHQTVNVERYTNDLPESVFTAGHRKLYDKTRLVYFNMFIQLKFQEYVKTEAGKKLIYIPMHFNDDLIHFYRNRSLLDII